MTTEDDAKMTTTKKTKTMWEGFTPTFRQRLVWNMWFVTWILLLLGYIDRGRAWPLLVLFSAIHSIVFLFFFVGDGNPIMAFPVQVRIAYFLWVAAGTYVPGTETLMWITTLGLTANLFADYCPLARLITLCPWNRKEPLSLDLLQRTFLSPPSKGRFEAKPSPSSVKEDTDTKED